MKLTPIAAITAFALCGAAWAQDDAVNLVLRDANQQQRIERGLESGQLSIREAGRLERRAQQIERDQAEMLRGGLRPDEQARIAQAQHRLGHEIGRERRDERGDEMDARSAQRMRDIVQRSANQQKAIAGGLHAGDLTNREAARLERGQARVSGDLALAAQDGDFSRVELDRLQNVQRHQRQRIYARRHDERTGDYRRY